jgi:hypothetical protein
MKKSIVIVALATIGLYSCDKSETAFDDIEGTAQIENEVTKSLYFENKIDEVLQIVCNFTDNKDVANMVYTNN